MYIYTLIRVFKIYFGWPLFTCFFLSASGSGTHFLQLKTEIEAMVLTHFTPVYFRLLPHTCSWAQQEEGPTELDP